MRTGDARKEVALKKDDMSSGRGFIMFVSLPSFRR